MIPTPHRSHPLLGFLAVTMLMAVTDRAPVVAATDPPNLVLISVDTLRADRLGVYGFEGGISPNVDALAERGLVFEDVLSVIGKTGPSFASIFSSLFPPTHGARRNSVRMRDDVPVLAEILQAQGYDTAAFISNWTLKRRLAGVDRGFDHYDEEFNKARNALGLQERDASDVTAAALAWLRKRDSPKPVLLWVHYSEPHSPYELQRDVALPKPAASQRHDGWRRRWRYASEVALTDVWIGKLLAAIRDDLPPSETFIVFLSDHGESLGEHRYWGHGKNTHWPNLRVPWIVAGPGVPARTRVRSPTSLIDVLPTVLDLLNVEAPEGIAGVSRVGSWRSPDAASPPRYAIGERGASITRRSKSRYGHPLTISMQTGDAKAIYDFSARSLAYFDLRADPLEVQPLDAAPVELRPPLGRRLQRWYQSLPKYEQKRGELTPEDIQQLKGLGYL